jgi:hypothetical protein
MSEETQAKAPETSAPAAPQAASGSESSPVSSSGPSSGSGPGSSSGPRPGGRPGGGRPSGGPGGRGKFFRRKKVCKFCTEKIDAIPYRDVRLLARLCGRARQDRAPAAHRRLHQAPAPPDPRHQAGPEYRPAAVCHAALTIGCRSAVRGCPILRVFCDGWESNAFWRMAISWMPI